MELLKVNHRKGERPKIQLTVRRVEPSVWYSLGFAQEHYLTSKLNKSCKCLLFEWDGVPVGFAAIINSPRVRMPYACAVSRLVVLPDYQGLGLSTQILNFVGGIVKSLSDAEHNYRLFIKTAHRKFGEAMARNPNIRSTTYDGKGISAKQSKVDKKYRNRLTRVSYCKEYIGEPIYGYEHLLRPIAEMRKEKMNK